ncbi:putative membrane protein [Lewinella marina]|uniref:Protoporphyrinogen IX oxidase n=1 Tax=Neolewinella marina TaxID=438751 RepID=A0A2G0CGV7_9BACT|nr:CopD family protein [Neolewinella marina]NJB86372.1 putative membrane protein [Neolewinella marina]PHK99160.1 TIGR00701 family protein [Neolewinella marina]
MNLILFAKALHVVGFVSWFAGLFFLGRLLVNHAETDTVARSGRPDAALRAAILREEYEGMEDRVYRIITNPAMMLTWVGGLLMVALNPAYFVSGTAGWLAVKLGAVVGLVGYQLYTKRRIMLPMQAGKRPLTPWQLRLWNEVPTFFLVFIVFTVVYGKVGELSYIYLGIGVLIFCLLVYRGAVAYRNRRDPDPGPPHPKS